MKERTIFAVWVVLGGWLVRGVWVEDLGCGGGGYFGRSGDAAEVRGLGVR